MKKIFGIVGILVVVAVVFSGCADVVTVDKCVDVEEAAGFWSGLWHGLITPFSFIGSLFSDDIAVYAVNNTGGWYDFGFLLGVGGLGFSGSRINRK